MSSQIRSLVQRFLLPLLLGIIALNSYRVVEKKDALFSDEITSFRHANEKYVTIGEFTKKLTSKFDNLFEVNRENGVGTTCVCVRDSFIRNLYVSEGQIGYDYSNILIRQTLDDTHPPLYYMLLHTVSSFTRSDDLFFIGGLINLVFLLLSCFFLYKLSILVTESQWLSFSIVIFYGFSYGYLGNLVLFRMYAMCACWVPIILYQYCMLEKKQFKLDKSLIVSICFVEFLGMFTHYYSFILILSLIAVTILKSKRNSDFQRYFVCANLITLFLFIVLWSPSFYQLYKGLSWSVHRDSLSIFLRLFAPVYLLFSNIFSCSILGFILFLIILVYSITKCKREKIKCENLFEKCIYNKYSLLVIPTVLTYMIIIFISPFISDRYVFPLFPILSLLIVLFVWCRLPVVSEKQRRAVVFILVALVSLFANLNTHNHLRYLYERTEAKDAFISKSVDLPAVIIGSETNWDFKEIVVNYNHPKYIITNSVHSESFLGKHLHEDKYIIYISRFADLDRSHKIVDSLGYRAEPLDYSTDYHSAYSLLKK